MRSAERMQESPRQMMLSYEELAQDTVGELRKALAFCGSAADPSAIVGTLGKKAGYKLLDRHSVLHENVGGEIRKPSTGWKKDLSLLDRLYFKMICGRRMKQAGYD